MNELGVKGLVLPFLLNSASLEHSNDGTIEAVEGGGRVSSLLRRVGRGGCNSRIIEVVGGCGIYVVVFLVNELGVKGFVLPFPLNSASLEHSNGGTI